MSEKSAKSPKDSPTPATGPAPSVRRISNPRPKKTAKVAVKPVEHAAEIAEVISAPVRPNPSKFPEFPTSTDAPEASETPSTRTDWPEPEAASSGAASAQDGPKRKRRRKKGKGGAAQNAAPHGENENLAQAVDAPTESSAPRPQHQNQSLRENQTPRSKPDAELLAKCAWKIYLAEISEEGVALVGDNDAKELSRRCFRLAEIFMEEQARRR